MFELTCPFDTNIERSHDFKREKYAPLVEDLSRNYKVFLFSYRGLGSGPSFQGESRTLQGFSFPLLPGASQVTQGHFEDLLKGGSACVL